MTVMEAMRNRLAVLAPQAIEIDDDSEQHVGHVGAQGGGGHFRLKIISSLFDGKRTIERHRMVYDALGPMMRQEIHAVSIVAETPDKR
jgi:BolA protein